jgi:hypothetical protein
MELLFIILGIPFAIAGVLSLPVIFFGRRRVQWQHWELIGLILPFCIWAVSFWMLNSSSSGRLKGWNNMFEPYLFCLTIPIGAIVRVIVGYRSQAVCAVIVIVGLCLIAALVALFTPNLGGSLG